MLAATVSLNSTTSWLTSANWRRSARDVPVGERRGRRAAACPTSARGSAAAGSPSVVLPAPDGPTSATDLAGRAAARSTSSSAGGWSPDSAASRRAARSGRARARRRSCRRARPACRRSGRAPRSSAASPRVIGPATSDRCLIGAISISIAVTKAAKPPTEPPRALCHSAATITADSAHAASTCVIGVIVAPAPPLHRQPAQRLARPRKRAACERAAPCRRTMRHASTFSSTT